jgi:hypothetical protein
MHAPTTAVGGIAAVDALKEISMHARVEQCQCRLADDENSGPSPSRTRPHLLPVAIAMECLALTANKPIDTVRGAWRVSCRSETVGKIWM